ncbi:MAG TPA: 3-isopropylmalate dehydratase small subunit [Herpetosiphonaceae bacterium]
MEPITTFSGTCVVLPIENIDTDQIIPARFLKATDKQGMGDHLFADWRYDEQGNPKPEFALNQPEAQGARILIGGHNFGCGSSREHAPWALQGFGFKAVISTYFADIFRNNALKVGLLPLMVEPEAHQQIIALCTADPAAQLTVDLEAQQVILPDGTAVSFPIDQFAKYCLLNGVDQLGFLLSQEDEIAQYEAEHGARVTTVLH